MIFWIFFLILSLIVEGIPMMKITGLSHLFKWQNLHNWWLTKYFFSPLYVNKSTRIYNFIYIERCWEVVKCMSLLCPFDLMETYHIITLCIQVLEPNKMFRWHLCLCLWRNSIPFSLGSSRRWLRWEILHRWRPQWSPACRNHHWRTPEDLARIIQLQPLSKDKRGFNHSWRDVCVCVCLKIISVLPSALLVVYFSWSCGCVCVHSPVLVVSCRTVGVRLLLYSCSQVQLTGEFVVVIRCK